MEKNNSTFFVATEKHTIGKVQHKIKSGNFLFHARVVQRRNCPFMENFSFVKINCPYKPLLIPILPQRSNMGTTVSFKYEIDNNLVLRGTVATSTSPDDRKVKQASYSQYFATQFLSVNLMVKICTD